MCVCLLERELSMCMCLFGRAECVRAGFSAYAQNKGALQCASAAQRLSSV